MKNGQDGTIYRYEKSGLFDFRFMARKFVLIVPVHQTGGR